MLSHTYSQVNVFDSFAILEKQLRAYKTREESVREAILKLNNVAESMNAYTYEGARIMDQILPEIKNVVRIFTK